MFTIVGYWILDAGYLPAVVQTSLVADRLDAG
jgi:hypothetical protein